MKNELHRQSSSIGAAIMTGGIRRLGKWLYEKRGPLYLLVVLWVNLYVCRGLFFVEHTGHMNAMHGFWMSMARTASEHWWRPAWWPFWDGGMPFEFTYAPLIPALTAFISKVFGLSVPAAFHSLVAVVYTAGPVAVYVMVRRLSTSPNYALLAALVYSLVSPSQLIVPDERFLLSHFWDARRLYLAVVWDEVPHLASLALLPLLLMALKRQIKGGRLRDYAVTALLMALIVSANAFGAVLVMFGIAVTLYAYRSLVNRQEIVRLALTGLVGYAAIAAFLPPSLILAIGRDAKLHGDSGWTTGGLTAACIVALGWVLLDLLLKRVKASETSKLIALFGWLAASTPLIDQYLGRHFLPQPGRYKVEFEMAAALLIAYFTWKLLRSIPKTIAACLIALLVSLGLEQLISLRRFAKDIIRSTDIRETIEYRTARWVEQHLEGQRVMLPGSIGQWNNAFTNVAEFSGGSYSTAFNPVQQIGLRAIYSADRADTATLWLRAFGVTAIAVPGRDSKEFWKSLGKPERFDSLPALWSDDGVTVRSISDRQGLAHVIPADKLVRRPPRHELDLDEVRGYVSSIDSGLFPSAALRWQSANSAAVETTLQRDQVLSVQMSYHPGWRAFANGRAATVSSDGLGLLVVKPECNGACAVRLEYNGGNELILCRLVSLITWMVVPVVVIISYRSERRKRTT